MTPELAGLAKIIWRHPRNETGLFVPIQLKKFRVYLPGMLLKTNLVASGLAAKHQAKPNEIARATLAVFKAALPKAVPGIVFLSGGLTPDQSTEYLKMMNKLYSNSPWQLSYSFGRALQQEGLRAWSGKSENIKKVLGFLNGKWYCCDSRVCPE